jgi:16S rRNA (guanine527-N7)-methyltransferase
VFHVEREVLAERLAGPCEGFGVALPEAAVGSLARYVELLLEWGARINLTSARTAEEIVDAHLADALGVIAAVPAHAASLIDVGSGAGLPGVVVSVLRPGIACTLLEPRSRRWAFLREVRRALALDNLTPVQERLEAHVVRPDFRPYAVAVSRATWPVAEWLQRASGLVEPGGRVIGLEGRGDAELPAGAVRRRYELALSGRAGAVVTLDLV